ncbi:MAG: PQQ-dependent sugar dehydrogenase, partial [Patescibacteria group bacterium]|nr:PQQ-dependent sugar dehydrogenase [Patescibacteria group bacterium]
MSISGTSMTIAQNEKVQDISNTALTYSHQTIQSPLVQYRSGIDVQSITCNVGLQLILKAEDNSPACVRPDTAQKLMER